MQFSWAFCYHLKRSKAEPADELLEWADGEIPDDLRDAGEECLANAPEPRVFDVQVEKVKVEEGILKKPALPFDCKFQTASFGGGYV